jgi:hypothetical protein
MYGDQAEEFWKSAALRLMRYWKSHALPGPALMRRHFTQPPPKKNESAELFGECVAYLVPVDSKTDENAPSYKSEKKVLYAEVENALKKA